MAETRKIVIEILDGDSGSGEKKTKEKDPNKEMAKTVNKFLHPLKTKENALMAKSAILTYSLQQAKQISTQMFSFNIDRKLSLTENYIAQNEFNNFKTTISKAKSLIGTAGSGAVTGAQTGGAWGAALGAALGAVAWGVGQYTENRANLSSYYQEINTTNYNSQFSRTRAGLVDGGRGTEN